MLMFWDPHDEIFSNLKFYILYKAHEIWCVLPYPVKVEEPFHISCQVDTRHFEGSHCKYLIFGDEELSDHCMLAELWCIFRDCVKMGSVDSSCR